jgi:hypothetical protein
MATQLKAIDESWDEGERATGADTPYTRRARYFDSGNAFALKYPPVPCHQFLAERARALDPATGTAVIPLDLGDRLGTDFPATTPLILTSYLRIRARDTLRTRLKASGELYYVIAGSGETGHGADRIAWGAGDVFCLPGGGESTHVAGAADCVLWLITNEPQLAFEHLEPPAQGNAVTGPVHYPAAEIASQLQRVGQKLKGHAGAGFLERRAGALAQHPADAHARREPAAARSVPAPAPAQLRRGHAQHPGQELLFPDRRPADRLAGARRHGHPARGRAFAPQRRRRADDLPDRAGRRALLPLPDHGLRVRRLKPGAQGERT